MKEIFISLNLLTDLEQEALILLKRLSGQTEEEKKSKYITAFKFSFFWISHSNIQEYLFLYIITDFHKVIYYEDRDDM